MKGDRALQKGLLVVISGPSGAGKGTICKALVERNKTVKLSVSCTTRKPRSNEKDGINYYFLAEEKFKDMVKNDEFLEYANVYGNFYGTPRYRIEELLNKGIDVILEIDIQGALKVNEKFSEGVFIFILPPSMNELKARIKKRGSETEESLIRRFNSAFKEINYVSRYKYMVTNDKVEDAVKKVESIITAEKCRVDRIKDAGLDLIQEGLLNE